MREIIISSVKTGYFACKDGRIYSSKRGIFLKPYPTGTEDRTYLSVDICCHPHRFRSKSVHLLIWRAFYGDVPEGLEINHIDGDKHNPSLDNLEAITHSENCKHSFRIGLQSNVGELHPNRKINDTIAKNIKIKISQGERLIDISKDEDVSIHIIKDIARNKTWKHIQI